MRVALAKASPALSGDDDVLRMAISTAPQLPRPGRVGMPTCLEWLAWNAARLLGEMRGRHLQQVMMSVRWRKSLQSVVFLALCVGQVRWTIASGHIWRTLITVSARFIPVNVGPLLAGIGSFNRRLYFATVKEGCTPNRHDSTEALVQYSLAQVQLTTQRYHTRVELYSNIPTGHSTAIPTWYCG